MDTTEVRLMRLMLVEDDDDHALIVQRFLRKCRIANSFFRVSTGEEAVNFFNQPNVQKDPRYPDLVLLDLKLPGVDGFQVLESLKQNPASKTLPVVILSSSASDIDRKNAYQKGANSFLVKPVDMKKFQEMIDALALYWGVINTPPVNQ